VPVVSRLLKEDVEIGKNWGWKRNLTETVEDLCHVECAPTLQTELCTCLHRAALSSTPLIHQQVHLNLIQQISLSLFPRHVSAHLYHLLGYLANCL
jgi:hypothetical protein